MIIQFRTLFTLAVSDSYYRYRCEDFEFPLVGDTARLLRNGKLLSKVRQGKVHVLFETDQADQPLIRLDGEVLCFGLLLKNPSFRSFTEIPWDGTEAVLYRNDASPPALDPPKVLTGQVAKEAARNNLFGIVEIRIDAAFYATPPAFTVSFSAREEELRYYVVTRNYSASDVAHLTLSDEGAVDDGRTRVDFTKLEGAALNSDTTASLLKTSDEVRVVLFKSEGLVARTQAGRRKIRLRKNGDTIIANMPQPGPDRANSNMTVYISKP